ncbi:ketopantoate reductase family protein [Tellurirhabdus rosea]|uniref:ketopantoate reductase family protein n=1 Tax=Tellurirhabdus rosea TaxID=2674997 RepID=UPI00225ABEC5|nr:2-dehydropantoate 2-reductase N-terminal domain-containing protein [Tellurirhabdus rosea]
MNILVFGSGTIGILYGWAFTEAGHHVTHYIRPGGSNTFQNGPVTIAVQDRRSRAFRPQNRTYEPPFVHTFYPSDHYDLILVPVTHRHVRATLETLQNRAGDATILFFGNQWETFGDIEHELAGRYLFGFPQNGGALQNNILEGTLTSQVVLAEPDGRFTNRLKDIQALFEQSGFAPRLEPDFKGWSRVHFAWNAATMSVALREGGMLNYAHHFGAIRHSFRVMRETMAVVRAMGTEPRRFSESRMAYSHSFVAALITRLLFLVVPSVMTIAEKHARTSVAELKSYYYDLYAMARRLNVQTPLFDALKPTIDALPDASLEPAAQAEWSPETA